MTEETSKLNRSPDQKSTVFITTTSLILPILQTFLSIINVVYIYICINVLNKQ